jgi:hypothetical protein
VLYFPFSEAPRDTVEKVAPWFYQFSRVNIDLSDWPTNRSRMPANGKKIPEVRRVSPSAGRKSAT